MTSPLTPAHDAALNHTTPQTASRYEEYEVKTYTTTTLSASHGAEAASSSPFLPGSNDSRDMADQENLSPSKSRHSRVISGNELSPLKLSAKRSASRDPSPERSTSASSMRSPRKVSPEKRFPVRISDPQEAADSPAKQMDLEDVLRQNEGLKKAIEIFEDEQSAMEVDEAGAEAAGPDDTMMSTFSTFSAVPSAAMFSRGGQSPAKSTVTGGLTPRGRLDVSPSRAKRSAPSRDSESTINLLMDFTEQLRNPQRMSPSKRDNLSGARSTPNGTGTPSRTFNNLIDFDIPPMPTPRSVPSITPRELESLKSKFLSEISSLKASLSGKEAEVQSLKTAVGDAEKRVGESMEQLREERSLKEQVIAEKEDWESRGREMEGVLRTAKEEIVLGQREKEELEQKLDESEKRREAAEMLHQEAESKMAGMRAGKDVDRASPEKAKSPGASSTRDVEVAVERVARELHGLYKSKHETKVAALKKSYEARWDKKIRELERRIEELVEDNDKLRVGRDNTLTKVMPGSADVEERKAQAAKDGATIKELEADIQRLEAVVSTVQRDNGDLRGLLEKERVEKGELVQLAEEMMSMQSFVGGGSSAGGVAAATPAPASARRTTLQENQPPVANEFKTPRANRSSGLRAPGTGLRAPHERTKSSGGGGALPRPGSIARSGIMSSIEQMGSHRRRGAE